MKNIIIIVFISFSFINTSFSQTNKHFPDGTILSYADIYNKRSGYTPTDTTTIYSITGIYSQELDNTEYYNLPQETVLPIHIKQAIVNSDITAVRYNHENGSIKKGDFLTISTTPGVAAKAIESGMVIGIALEDSKTEQGEGLLKIKVLIQYLKL